MARSPDHVDKNVGLRIRLRRLMLGHKQQSLANVLGVSFQQVQKYEKGSNRIGVGRLQQVATFLKVPVSFFFEESDPLYDPRSLMAGTSYRGLAEPEPSPYVADNEFMAEGVSLARTFARITSPALRRHILTLVESIANAEQVKEGSSPFLAQAQARGTTADRLFPDIKEHVRIKTTRQQTGPAASPHEPVKRPSKKKPAR